MITCMKLLKGWVMSEKPESREAAGVSQGLESIRAEAERLVGKEGDAK